MEHPASHSPFMPHAFRSLSDTYTDSPSSSSSFLSSSTCSPASLLSSNTCSPWETCPGLQPESPNIPLLDELNIRFPPFSTNEDPSPRAFNNMSLSSPLRSPISLAARHTSSAVNPMSLMHTSGASTIQPSSIMPNALALDLQEEAIQTPHPSQGYTLPPFGGSATSPPPPNSSRSSPLSDAPSHSVPSYTGGSADSFSFSSGFPSESLMLSRATRRKTSKIDYAEAAYDGDSDDDFVIPGSDATIRNPKRRKASSASVAFSVEGESDEDSSDNTHNLLKRSGKRSVSRSGAGAASKRKCKRRHHCPREGCSSSFTRITDMDRHISSVHRAGDTDANRCTFCHKAFSREDAVLRHENDSCPMRPRKKSSAPAELWA